jgi:hypothetical protein
MNPRRRSNPLLRRLRLALLAVVAIAAVTAPTAAANKYPPLKDSLELTDLDTFDLYVTIACDKEVSATISGVLERTLVFDNDGVADHQIETFDGTIRWYTEDGKSYSSALENRTRIDFPEGVGYFNPAKITATAYHGGSPLLVGTNPPPGRGTLVYNGFIYAVDDEGFVYAAADGDPISMSGNFARMTERICAALA